MAVTASRIRVLDGGNIVLNALTVVDGVAYSYYLQDPTGEAAVEPLDRADFLALVAAVDLPESF